MKVAWIKRHVGEFSVDAMSRFMAVFRSSYYALLGRPQDIFEKDNAEWGDIIKVLFKESRKPRNATAQDRLSDPERQVSRRRLGRLMQVTGLACKTKQKFKVTTNSKHTGPIAPNLLDHQITIARPINSMLVISPISLPWKVGCTWQWLLIYMLGR
jgi:transposase InsO family protein